MSILRPVRITDETTDRLRVLAFLTGKTYGELLAEAVLALIASTPNLKARYEAAKKALS